jgi:hypothetical protein
MSALGLHGDRIGQPDDIVARARQHRVTATLVSYLAQMLMLQPGGEP